LIYLRDISLLFGARTLFAGVDLTIKAGEKIGLVGRNGSGKSTFLRLLSGHLSADSGVIEIPSNYKIGFLQQTVDLDLELNPLEVCGQAFAEIVQIEQSIGEVEEKLNKSQDPEEQTTLAEELYTLYERQNILGAEQRSGEIEKVLKGMGFREEEFHKPLKTFSGGWRMRVELSRLLLTQPDLLLLDEPTNHLDIESILWFIDYLKEYDGTVIVVSHDQHFLDKAMKRTLEVEFREIRDYPFSYHKAMLHKEDQRSIRESAYQNQQRQIAHKERLIEKFRAKASKAKFAKSLQTELDRMDLVELDDSDNKAMRLRFEAGARSGKVVYKMHRLKKVFGPKVVISDFDFAIDKGARIAFVGQNGQGKTTLAKIMAGVHTADGGEVEVGANVALGYYAQDQPDNIPRDKRVIEVLRDAAPMETEGRLRSVLGSFLFSGDDVDKKCSVLSGGERARLAFACMILTPSNVLILDEPTNHLDIQSKDILKRALQEYEGTLIVVSHDVYFLSGLTETTLEFADGKIKYHLYGIDEFLERHQVDDLSQLEFKAKPAPAEVAESNKKSASGRDRKSIQRQIQNLEKHIERLETEKSQLEEEMALPHFYSRPESAEKTRRYEAVCSELSTKTAEWEQQVSEYEA